MNSNVNTDLVARCEAHYRTLRQLDTLLRAAKRVVAESPRCHGSEGVVALQGLVDAIERVEKGQVAR